MPPAPGIRPSLISGRPSFAAGDATRPWQASATSSPPPSATPWIAATTGFARALDRVEQIGQERRDRRLAELADIGAGDEGAPARRDHDGVDRRIGCSLGDGAARARRAGRRPARSPAGCRSWRSPPCRDARAVRSPSAYSSGRQIDDSGRLIPAVNRRAVGKMHGIRALSSRRATRGAPRRHASTLRESRMRIRSREPPIEEAGQT